MSSYEKEGSPTQSDFAQFNFDKLEKELEATVAAEKQYWLENDAKIRAVKQGVPTYDHFREMVMGAHLKPLEKGEKVDQAFTRSRNQPWNTHASNFPNSEAADKKDLTCTALSNSAENLPSNHAAFTLQWKRCGNDSNLKYHFLLRYPKEGNISLSQVFKTDLPSGIFADCCSVLNDLFTVGDEEHVITVLEHLSTSKRFKLTIDFLSKGEKAVLYSLFGKFSSVNNELKQVYRVAQSV